jgi:hypothetical protein
MVECTRRREAAHGPPICGQIFVPCISHLLTDLSDTILVAGISGNRILTRKEIIHAREKLISVILSDGEIHGYWDNGNLKWSLLWRYQPWLGQLSSIPPFRSESIEKIQSDIQDLNNNREIHLALFQSIKHNDKLIFSFSWSKNKSKWSRHKHDLGWVEDIESVRIQRDGVLSKTTIYPDSFQSGREYFNGEISEKMINVILLRDNLWNILFFQITHVTKILHSSLRFRIEFANFSVRILLSKNLFDTNQVYDAHDLLKNLPENVSVDLQVWCNFSDPRVGEKLGNVLSFQWTRDSAVINSLRSPSTWMGKAQSLTISDVTSIPPRLRRKDVEPESDPVEWWVPKTLPSAEQGQGPIEWWLPKTPPRRVRRGTKAN